MLFFVEDTNFGLHVKFESVSPELTHQLYPQKIHFYNETTSYYCFSGNIYRTDTKINK